MRCPASEKLEIIRIVENGHLPTKQTLDMLGIPRAAFYRWQDLYLDGGPDALADRSPRPKSVWNRILQQIRDNFIEFALDHEALTSRELAVKYTDEKRYFISESSAYRILKAADLITAPAHVVIKAAAEFTDKTVAINEMLLSCMLRIPCRAAERWHQTMKNRVLLEKYYLPGDLERQIGAFVEHYNNERYHESLNNVTPADGHFGRDKSIIRERAKIKIQTIQKRRLQHQKQAA